MKQKKIYLMRPFVGDQEITAIKEVFDSNYLTEGPVTHEFERKFAEFIGVKYAIAVTSCMTGLDLVLRTLNISKGDEVIVPDFTHPATGDCAYMVGADAVLVDVDLENYNMDASAIESAITEKTKCIIPVSWGGNPIDPDIYKIGRENDIPVFEDSACSTGAELNGMMVGSIADVSCFSFHPRKIMTTGEGGMVTTNNEIYAEKANALKHFGQTKNGRFTYHGTNYKMSNIVAAVGIEQLKKLPGILDDRINKAKRYSDLFMGTSGVRTPFTRKGTKHIYQSYCIYLEEEGIRDKLKKDLAERNIESQIGTYALHLEPSYSNVNQIGHLQNSELLFKNLLTLPLHHELTEDDQDYVVDSVKSLLKKYGV